MADSVAEMLLKPIQRALDAGVRYSTTAEALCARLDGRSLQLQAGPDSWAVWFCVADGRLVMNEGQVENPSAVISGSLVSLSRLAMGDAERIIRAGDVAISGDTDVADDFRALLTMIRPDPEEELAKVVGDPIAHELGKVFRGARSWAKQARRSFGRSAGEYLTEESRDLVAPPEIEEFCADVDQIVLAADRAEAQLKLIKQQRSKEDR